MAVGGTVVLVMVAGGVLTDVDVPVGTVVAVCVVVEVGVLVPVAVTVGLGCGQRCRNIRLSEVYGNPDRSELPTAHTSSEETAATPYRRLKSLKPFGLNTLVHAVPSQCMMRVWNGPKLSGELVPTAQMSSAATALTARSML